MKMVFDIYGTWRQVIFEKLMMKIYDFFFIRLSRLVALHNNMSEIFHHRDDFYILVY